MVSFKTLASLFLISTVAAVPAIPTEELSFQSVPSKPAGCGKLNTILVGFPPHHPLVTSHGWDGDFVAQALTNDTAKVYEAGYNYMRLLLGPEQNATEIISKKMKGIKWDVALVGFGVRGANDTVTTSFFETILSIYREKAPKAVFAFNHSPASTLEAIQRHAKISGDCTQTPGKDLGTETFCDVPGVCPKGF